MVEKIKCDVLLINLGNSTILQKNDTGDAVFLNLGCLSIKSYLNLYGHSVRYVDYNMEKFDYSSFSDIICCETNLLLIGINVFTENKNDVIKIARFIKKVNPNVKIAVGGPHATLACDDFLSCMAIDFIVIGEGESSYLEIIEMLKGNDEIQPTDITNVLVNRRELFVKKALTRIGDLDLLPIINREYCETRTRSSLLNVYSSKGCPAKCIYCSATALAGATYRVRDVRSIYMEIILAENVLGCKPFVYFVDDTFTAMKKRIYQFTELIDKYSPGFVWSCESRMDVITEEMIDVMYEHGCNSIQFGIESGSQEVLNKIRKNIDLDKARRIIQYAAKYKMTIFLSFMLGHYCDTIETMEQTIEFMNEMKRENPNLGFGIAFNTPFPGTWQYEHAEEIGIKFLTKNYSMYDLNTVVIESLNYNKKEIQELYRKAEKIISRSIEDEKIVKGASMNVQSNSKM